MNQCTILSGRACKDPSRYKSQWLILLFTCHNRSWNSISSTRRGRYDVSRYPIIHLELIIQISLGHWKNGPREASSPGLCDFFAEASGNSHWYVPRVVNNLFIGRTQILTKIVNVIHKSRKGAQQQHRFVITGMGGPNQKWNLLANCKHATELVRYVDIRPQYCWRCSWCYQLLGHFWDWSQQPFHRQEWFHQLGKNNWIFCW